MQELQSAVSTPETDDGTVERLVDALEDLAELLAPHVQACASSIGLAAPYAMALRRMDGSTPMKELAHRLHCDPSFVTTIADALEEQGYATRRSDPHDRRMKDLVLTQAGIEAQARFRRDLATQPPGLRAMAPADQVDLLRLISAVVVTESQGLDT